MDRVRETKAGLRLLPAVKYPPRFRSDLWLSPQSQSTLAANAAQFRRTMGLERAAHDVIRSRLARNFPCSANRARHSRRGRGSIEHSGARIKISIRGRYAHA